MKRLKPVKSAMMAYPFQIVGNTLSNYALVFSCLMMTMMLLACFICCLMRHSDRKERYCLIDLAKKKGVLLDLEALRGNMTPTAQDEMNAEHPCPMAVPNLGIFVS